MTYIYGCKECKVSLESDAQEIMRCATCGREMGLLATKQWLFKFSNCGQTLEGGPGAKPHVSPCPFCDGGVMHPSRSA